MITPPNGPITPPTPPTYDGIWLPTINISAPSPTQFIRATISVCPFNSTTGLLGLDMAQTLTIPDIMTAAQTDLNIAGAMEYIFKYVQEQITSGSVSF